MEHISAQMFKGWLCFLKWLQSLFCGVKILKFWSLYTTLLFYDFVKNSFINS